MELGLTFPLQRFLKRKPPAYGTEPDRRFCWDLHIIDLRGRSCLLAVHCHTRYTFVRWDVAPFQWADLPGLFREGAVESLTSAGFSPHTGGSIPAASRNVEADPYPWPPGGCVPEPGMGRCDGVGYLPGHQHPGPAAAGSRRQHPPQPVRRFGWPGPGLGADGECTFREDKRVKRRLSRVASPVMHSKPMTAGNCFCTGSSILTGLEHCAASRKLSIQKTSVRGVFSPQSRGFCYCG